MVFTATARTAASTPGAHAPEDGQAVAARARLAWARLIHKVYEVDPLKCVKCSASMRAHHRETERASADENRWFAN